MGHIELYKNQQRVTALCLKFLNRSEEQLEEDIDILEEWLKNQPHLPEVPSRHHIFQFLKMEKGSIEMAKKKLDMYYTVRKLMPEIFERSHPKLPNMQDVADKFYMLPIPKHTQDGNIVVIFSMKPSKIEDTPSYFHCAAHFLNIIEVRIAEEVSIRDVIIYDFEGLSMAHVMKLTPTFLKQMSLLFTGIFLTRIQHIHFINCPLSEFVMGLMKKFVSRKVSERIIVHDKLETLLDYLSKDVLPRKYGGTFEMSMEELNDLWRVKLTEYYWRFDELSKMEVKEELRPTPLKNNEFLGYYGNFKKIDVD